MSSISSGSWRFFLSIGVLLSPHLATRPNWPCSDHRPASGEQLEHQGDDSQYQQNVNKPAQRVAADYSQQPQHQKDDEQCPKHIRFLRLRFSCGLIPATPNFECDSACRVGANRKSWPMAATEHAIWRCSIWGRNFEGTLRVLPRVVQIAKRTGKDYNPLSFWASVWFGPGEMGNLAGARASHIQIVRLERGSRVGPSQKH